jgi:hypothetical protein
MSSGRTFIRIGSLPLLFLRFPYQLSLHDVTTHMHIIGVSGSGKSRFLASLYLTLLRAGHSVTLIDPHATLAKLILRQMVADGTFRDKAAFDRIIYLDIPGAQRLDRYLPFNVLRQHTDEHAVATNIVEAMHRAWPNLADGVAPMFDTLVQNGAKVLLSNRIPLPQLYRFLTDKDWRNQLLTDERDQDVVSVFRDWYDTLPPRDQLDMSGSTLRRVNLLTFDPVLKYSIGQSRNLLDFRQILDSGRSAIINLAITNPDAKRLFGSFLTVSAELGALSRADLPPEQPLGVHHLIIDEFSQFTAQSEEALTTMLSQTRKYGLYLTMAHQTWSQANDRIKGALQNVGIDMAFRLGRPDAEYTAKLIGRVDAKTIRENIDEIEADSVGMNDQWEEWIQELQELRPRHAVIAYHTHEWWRRLLKFPDKKVSEIIAPDMPDPVVDNEELARVEREYLSRYFTPKSVIDEELAFYRTSKEPSTRRAVPLSRQCNS